MKTELGFLMDLFLNDELPKEIKKCVADRIREVEENFMKPAVQISRPTSSAVQNGVIPGQAPSMQKIMEANPDIMPIVVTPAAAAALQQRAAIMQGAASEKPPPGRTGPRKF